MSEISRLTELVTSEYQSNRRLQWMLVAVLVILSISSVKWVSDVVAGMEDDVQRLVDLSSKLEFTASQRFDEELLTTSQETLARSLALVPNAGSMSTAEAKALKQLEQILGNMIKRKRLNLLGSEELKSGNNLFWQVRIEISGQLDNPDLIAMLSNFDASQPHRRISSLRYRPKASNALSLVADFLYGQTNE